jgi:hypothetical protein
LDALKKNGKNKTGFILVNNTGWKYYRIESLTVRLHKSQGELIARFSIECHLEGEKSREGGGWRGRRI